MLNKNNERELAYAVTIDAIEPITGSDNCEAAVIGGWRVMVKKNTFKAGDTAVYFEIDSKVDTAKECFAFMEKYHGRVKTQKYTFGGKGNFISQGLIMSFEDLAMQPVATEGEDRFLTKQLGVTYYVPEDNTRKSNSVDKYKKMAQRHGKLFSHQPFRWLMKRAWGRKLLFIFFGHKRDTKSAWPEWVSKTDEERIQNMPYILDDKEPWVVTEKIDGTSTTFTLKRKKFGKADFRVCSRNVVFTKDKQNCFYDTNVYVEMAEKYDVEKVLTTLLDLHPDWEWVTLQGETYGGNIQRRDYSTKEHFFKGFNLINSVDGRLSSIEAEAIVKRYGIDWVPIIDESFILPDTVDELLEYATGNSVVDGLPREGFVFRSLDGKRSFKAVSNEFLLKYHRG